MTPRSRNPNNFAVAAVIPPCDLAWSTSSLPRFGSDSKMSLSSDQITAFPATASWTTTSRHLWTCPLPFGGAMSGATWAITHFSLGPLKSFAYVVAAARISSGVPWSTVAAISAAALAASCNASTRAAAASPAVGTCAKVNLPGGFGEVQPLSGAHRSSSNTVFDPSGSSHLTTPLHPGSQRS